jgi:flagellin
MAMTINNVGTLTLLNLLNKTSNLQANTMQQMSTGQKVNRGADDPAGLLALSKLNSELTATNAGIQSNQRTDAMLGVADNALSEVSNLMTDIQRLANETANSAGLSAEEIAANQSQIDDALASIDRIVSNTNFNGKKLLDGSLGIASSLSGTTISDVKVFSRNAANTGTTTLVVHRVSAATTASATAFNNVTATSTAATAGTFQVQGKLGSAVIAYTSGENLTSIRAKIVAAKSQTGVSAVMSGTRAINLYSTDKGSAAFIRTKAIEGTVFKDKSDTGVDAVVTVNGQDTAVDGTRVSYSGSGISVSFDATNLVAADVGIKIDNSSSSGATFQLGTNSATRATLGIDSVYTANLGDATNGYLKSLGSGGSASLLTDPNKAATIARAAALQVSTLQGRIGGFQKFQVRTSLNSLNQNKEGLEKAKGVINDLDYAVATAELNRQSVLTQTAMSLLSMSNQQSSQVLSLLR